MENVRPDQEADEILRSLHDGLKKAEEVMTSMLQGMVADNAAFLSELEAALNDMEAALLND